MIGFKEALEESNRIYEISSKESPSIQHIILALSVLPASEQLEQPFA
jgi:hypothetical protein